MTNDVTSADDELARQSPSVSHRALTVVAAGALLTTLRGVWTAVTPTGPGLGLAITLFYVALLSLVVAAGCVRSRRALTRVDLMVLVTAVLFEAVRFHNVVSGYHYFTDEGALTSQAISALRHGVDPYRLAWPRAVAFSPTRLMGGGIVDRFDYPPLGVVVGAGAGFLWHGLATAAFVDALAIVTTAIFAFVVLPIDLRPLAVLVIAGLNFDTARAVGGDPVVIVLPFLAFALWKWTTVGAGGSLSRPAALRAVCLGLAAATQQLVWFLIPFVLVGMWRIRRAELSRRQAGLVVARYAAVSAAAFAVVNLPFVIVGPRLWWHGVTDVFTQHAVIMGQGVAMISADVLHGSGALVFYSYATALMYLALLIVFAVAIRGLGPAVVVIPTTVFLLSVRSQDSYYLALAPVWILTAITTPRSAFDLGKRSTRAFLARPVARRLVAAALFVPALACLVVAMTTPRPLQMHVVAHTSDPIRGLDALSVEVRNGSGHTVRPHFALQANTRISAFWTVVRGPAQLQPHQQVIYQLRAPVIGQSTIGLRLRLAAVSDGPETLSTISLSRIAG